MKIVIFSDSHGNCGNMRETLKKERPGMVFYLGDGLSDIEQVMERFPDSGHTHDACIWEDRGVTILNPGSVGSYYAPTYGVVEAEDGLIRRMVIRKVEHPVYER